MFSAALLVPWGASLFVQLRRAFTGSTPPASSAPICVRSPLAAAVRSPPMVLASLDRGSDLLALVRETGRFGLNVLGADAFDQNLARL